jgi:magnesium transporter
MRPTEIGSASTAATPGATVAAESPAPAHRHRAESAAGHVVRRVPVASGGSTVASVVAALSGARLDAADALYVVDATGRLEGLVPLVELLAADPAAVVRGIMRAPAPHVSPDSDQEQAALTAIRHDLTAVPVVDAGGAFLGVVPASALLDILRREHVEDIHRLAGIQRETAHARGALEMPPARRARDRLPWLLAGLVGSMMASLVVARFERLLAAQISVAFFVPAIVYLADAVGTQTEAVAVRGLSVSHMPLRRLLAGELRTGLIIGLTLAALSFPMVTLVVGEPRLAAAVALAVLLAGALASTIGLLLPWLLSHTGRDPAFGSGPLATVVQDVLSLVVYFAVVSLLFP